MSFKLSRRDFQGTADNRDLTSIACSNGYISGSLTAENALSIFILRLSFSSMPACKIIWCQLSWSWPNLNSDRFLISCISCAKTGLLEYFFVTSKFCQFCILRLFSRVAFFLAKVRIFSFNSLMVTINIFNSLYCISIYIFLHYHEIDNLYPYIFLYI